MTNQPLDILSPSGSLIRKHMLSVNCSRKFSLMNEDSITLRFQTREAMQFPVGSSVGDFYITQEQVGKWNENTGVWGYELKFDAYYWLWANKILRYIIPDVDSARETSFTLTATIDIHANVIKNCLDFLGVKYEGSPFRIDTNDETLSGEAKLVRYENLSVLGGIQAIAEAFECEWWVIGNAIYFGRCENSDSKHVFEAGINTSSISFQQAKSEAPNRLYVYGSERNIPTNYRKVDGNDTIGGVVVRRLMLPEGIPYLQTDPDIPEKQIVEKVVVIDSVYPRTSLTISEDPEVYTANGEDDEGQVTEEHFYRISYGTSFRFSESYVLPNEELHIVFESGLLNGMDFGAKFNPKGLNEKNADGSWNNDAQMIEIVVNEDYGRRLPDDILKPKKGDRFILYGWDATKMEDLGLITDAEEELLDEGIKALEEYSKDLSTCTCPMAWDYMKPLFATNSEPKPGDVVTIIDTAHFGRGGRKSRIIGYEYKLDKPYAECSYTCGENVSVKRLDSIEKKLDGLAKSGTKVQIQNSLDFLSKRYSDSTPYQLGVGSLKTNNFVSGLFGGIGAGIDERGNAEFESAVIRTALTVMELVINRQSVMGGDSIFSEGGTIENAEFVTANPDGTQQWMLELKEQYEGEVQEIQPGMVVRGVVNNLFDAAIEGSPALYYTSWMRVNGAELGTSGNRVSVTLYPDNEVPSGKNYPPCALMKLARWGHQTNEALQRLFMLSSHEGTLIRYEGVDKPIIDIGNIASLIGRAPAGLFDDIPGVKAGDEVAYFKTLLGNFIQTDHKGKPVPTIIDTGIYDPTRSYRHEAWNEDGSQFLTEDCWYLGCRWRCMVDGTVGVEPGYGVTAWGFVSGDPSFIVDFEEKVIVYDQRQLQTFGATLTLTATKYNCDVLPFIKSDNIQWGRESYDSHGALRTESDMAWKPTTDKGNKRLLLSFADLGYDGTPIGKITFWARVALDDADVQTIGVEIS